MDRFMKLANENAKRGIKNGDGGPFGAIILDENLNIIANGNNKVLKKIMIQLHMLKLLQ